MRNTTRRAFLGSSALSGGALLFARSALARQVAGEVHAGYEKLGKLNIAVIGCGGKGLGDMRAMRGENIVALCDVDFARAAKAFEEQPRARRYRDWRVLLDREKYLDAVVVSTPDHSHAVAAIAAMQRGLHVYCQKPLAHSVEEARVMRLAAARYGVVTQMGNQGTAMEGVRRAAEIIGAGAIGPVGEVHVWTDRPGSWWPQGLHTPEKILPIPATFRWDLWVGPREYRPYHRAYAPFVWRGWWDFGTGAIGDMACHTMNLAYLALELDAPASIEAEQEGMTDVSGPKQAVVRFEFPARGKDKPPVTLFWYEGGRLPPRDIWPVDKLARGGSMLLGEKGTLYSPNDYGAKFRLYPEKAFADYEGPEPSLPRTPGIYREWVAACKGGPRPMSNFDYAGRLTEAALLGDVAMRAGEKVAWDQGNLRATNSAKANRFVRDEYRYGYSIEI